MTQMPVYDYRISDELFKAIESEFKGDIIAKKYLESKNPDFFREIGKKWMDKTYELGTKPEYVDRIYEMIQFADKESGGEVRFPHEAQRFIEIAYLSAQLVGILDVKTSYMKELSYSISEKECRTFKVLKEELPEKELKALPCKDGCLSAAKRIFEILKMDTVSVSQTEKMTEDGICTFCAQKK